MQLLFPKNIFASLIKESLTEEFKHSIIYHPSSMLTGKLKEADSAVGLIPTMDLIQNNELFVSKSFGLSFDGALCNSYLYFIPDQKEISEIGLSGDVSSLEVILSKILFKEIYNTDIGLKIITDDSTLDSINHIIVGDMNFETGKFVNGISFAEEVADALNFPLVNYVFASKEKSQIEKINKAFEGLGSRIYDSIENEEIEKIFQKEVSRNIRENISSLIVEFDGQDMEGIEQLIRLPYYHGMINEIVEVNFV